MAPPPRPWRERGFDLVTEITKQVITLATGIIAISITFSSDFATHSGNTSKDLFVWSWSVFVVSILAGLMTLMASAGQQQKAADAGNDPTINSGNIRLLGMIQLLSFLVAIILTVIAGAVGT